MTQPSTSDDHLPERISNAGRAAVICSALGGLGWMGLFPLLDACDQGEQLARFFAYLFNLIVISVIGGISSVLMLVGWWMSCRALRKGELKPVRIARVALTIGTVVGVLTMVFYLLPAIFFLA